MTYPRRLLLTLLFSNVPFHAIAQEHPGPIERAVSRIAVDRRWAFEVPCAVGCATTQLTSRPSEWRKVQRTNTGARLEIRSTTASGERYFVHADDQSVVVLNLTVVSLTDVARRELIDAATRYPEQLLTTDRTWYAQEHVRIGRDGVFVDDLRVSDRAAVLERIERRDLLEVKRPKLGRGRSAGWGGVGAAIGFFAGVGLAADHSRDAAGRAYLGGFLGAAIGATTGILAAGRPEKIIYRNDGNLGS